MNEIWDAYNRDGRKLGNKIVKDEPIKDGLYHLASEVLVEHRDGSILCLRRSYQKEKYAGFYETTIRGYVLQGEDPMECIYRELKEKLCIMAFNLVKVNVVVSEARHIIYHVYTCTTSSDHDQVKMPREEAFEYDWFTKEQFKERLKRFQILPSQYLHFFNTYLERGFINNIKESYIYSTPVEVIMDKEYIEKDYDEYGNTLNINFGHIDGLFDEDNKPIEVYYVGLNKNYRYAPGIVLGVISYKNGKASKLVVTPENTLYTYEQIFNIIKHNEKDSNFELTMKEAYEI